MTRWEIRRVPATDTAHVLRTFETGWEPFAVVTGGGPREIWYRRPAQSDNDGRVYGSDPISGVEAQR